MISEHYDRDKVYVCADGFGFGLCRKIREQHSRSQGCGCGCRRACVKASVRALMCYCACFLESIALLLVLCAWVRTAAGFCASGSGLIQEWTSRRSSHRLEHPLPESPKGTDLCELVGADAKFYHCAQCGKLRVMMAVAICCSSCNGLGAGELAPQPLGFLRYLSATTMLYLPFLWFNHPAVHNSQQGRGPCCQTCTTKSYLPQFAMIYLISGDDYGASSPVLLIPATKNTVPVIILSAYHNEESIVEGLNAGANDYVSKPFRRQELLARMRMHLRHGGPGGKGSVADKEREEAEGKMLAAEGDAKSQHRGNQEDVQEASLALVQLRRVASMSPQNLYLGVEVEVMRGRCVCGGVWVWVYVWVGGCARVGGWV
ncbi:hypothetical protein DUNSADRAFT_4976 [Dunaliella salina]|uniref:Response regulatory domain-containing protein n=1 Tax=Dunaliella salina TaxID=3046 RepID=A0ABQ7GQW4_DUNSA|nr:hypothetical protein DUNSADRAFT_4976 [Dunaliella salina]|eukprot:KAF5837003.1 hypothetical protein DUNSADRAFT_4976 [Dunaliella salina]